MGNTTRRDAYSRSYMSSQWPRGVVRKQDRASWHSRRQQARGAEGVEDMPHRPTRDGLGWGCILPKLHVRHVVGWLWGTGKDCCVLCGSDGNDYDDPCNHQYHRRKERRGDVAPFRGRPR